MQASRRQEIIHIRTKINETENRKTLEKNNKTRVWFFKNINKIDKPLAMFEQGKKKKKQEDTNYQYQESKRRHHY